MQKANSWDLRYSFLRCLDQYAENPTKKNHSEFQTQSENTLTICDQKGAVEWKIVLGHRKDADRNEEINFLEFAFQSYTLPLKSKLPVPSRFLSESKRKYLA